VQLAHVQFSLNMPSAQDGTQVTDAAWRGGGAAVVVVRAALVATMGFKGQEFQKPQLVHISNAHVPGKIPPG